MTSSIVIGFIECLFTIRTIELTRTVINSRSSAGRKCPDNTSNLKKLYKLGQSVLTKRLKLGFQMLLKKRYLPSGFGHCHITFSFLQLVIFSG